MRRALIAALVAVPAGIALGFANQEADAVLRHGRWVAALGVPLLAACWAAGALAGRPLAGAVSGAVLLSTSTAAYYVLHVHHFGAERRLIPVIVGWGAASLAAGAIFGLAGGAWRAASEAVAVRIGSVALLAGALAGEAILLASEWPARVAPLLYAELLAAAALPILFVRPWRALPVALAVTAAAALVLGAAEHEVRETLRLAGWRGL
ncbi:MAG TPA: hypothetical protein VF587_12800 [Solirubrobacteraceae bacterium]|jgi:hypothetical protein